jgi:hypothetical protein
MMYFKTFQKPIRTLFERFCLAAWMVLMMANTIIVGLSVELLVFGLAFSLYHIFLIDEHTAPLLTCGVFATFNLPLIIRLRQYGLDNLNFELHENAMNQLMTPPESWSNAILTLLDENGARSNELAMIVRLIEEAPGPRERQDRRAEARLWLKENRERLTDEDREFAKQHLGYLR